VAALTIRHSGLIASGQKVAGSGRIGSVGVHIPPGLDLVILDGFTIRDFDTCVLAESPTILVNCEIERFRTAGIVFNGGAGQVEFCSFLDQRSDLTGACVVAGRLATSVKAANNLFHVEGSNRWFGIGTKVQWESVNNRGMSPNLFGVTGSGEIYAFGQITERSLDGIIEDAPEFARVTEGNEVLLLLHSSSAIRSVLSTLLPEIDNQRFDAVTRMPKVDRRGNKRAVEYLTAGAHEMSFAITQDAKLRILELISGISDEPFVSAASGRNGVFVRLPNTNSNPTSVVIEDPRDIQPSTDMAVLSFADKLFGDSSAYFKAERELKVPFLLSAQPSRKSSLDGAAAVSFMAWAKAASTNADTLLFRNGDGQGQDQAVIEVAQRFQGSVKPAMRLKLLLDTTAYDYAFVVEDIEALDAIEAAIAEDAWCFSGWSFDGLHARFYFGRQDDTHLKSYPARAYVFDALNDVMVPAQGAFALTQPRLIVDPNDQPLCVGSDDNRLRGWHGFIADMRLDIGQALDRSSFDVQFLSGKLFDDKTKLSKQIQQTDLLIARQSSLLVRVPGTPTGDYPGSTDQFTSIRKIVMRGDDVVIAGHRVGDAQDGVHLLVGSVLSTVVNNIPTIYDIAVDRAGVVVIVADDQPLTRIDLDEGERRIVALDNPPQFEFRSIGVSRNGEYVIGDFSDLGARLVIVRAPVDIASEEPAITESISLGSETLERPISIAVNDEDEFFILDEAEPKVVRVATWKIFQEQLGIGTDVSIPASATLQLSGVDFALLGVLPGDRLAFISDAEDLQQLNGEAVDALNDPVTPDNAGEFIISSVVGDTVILDRSLVAESPDMGMEFEVRVYRRNSTAVTIHRGLPLVAPNCIAFDSGNPSKPVLISDPAAVRASYDASVGVIFAIDISGALVPLYYRANLGFDLSTITSVALHPNPVLPTITVASTLRSRLVWHMSVDTSSRGTIKNAAFPGLSDLDVPRTSLNELLLIQDAAVSIARDAEDVVLTYETTFGTDPKLEVDFLNDEYETLSELGIVTKDGVVLLGRQTIARMPYDPLSPVITPWQQGLRITP
jgi:hypothetical protein